ncbi:MAG: TonB-dependent receptor domain-containing protein, partial [Enterobacteriaceae bacterium]
QQARDKVKRDRVSLKHNLQFNSPFADKLETQLSYQDSKTLQKTFENRVAATGPQLRQRDSRYQEKLWAFNSMLSKSFTTGVAEQQLSYGIDFKQNKSHDLRLEGAWASANKPYDPGSPKSDFPNPTTTQYAAFIQDQIEIGDWTLLPGLRYDHYKMAPKVTQNYLNTNVMNPHPADYRDSSWSPKLGLTWRAFDNHTLYAQYARGFRAPQAIEIFGEFENPGMYRTLANPNLKAETSNSYETGLRSQFNAFSFSSALFYNQYYDFIEQINRRASKPGFPRGEFQYTNQDKVIIKGIEAKGELDLSYLGLADGWQFTTALAYARSNPIVNSVDPFTAVLGLGYRQPAGRFGTRLDWTLTSKQNRIKATPGIQQMTTPGYGIVDLSAWWQVVDQVTLNAGIYNLTDRKYWRYSDVRGLNIDNPERFTQPGRYASVNAVIEF